MEKNIIPARLIIEGEGGSQALVSLPRGSEGSEGNKQSILSAFAVLIAQLTRIADSLEVIANRGGQELRPVYSVKEVAQMLGRSEGTVRRFIREGKLESSKSADGKQGQHLIQDRNAQVRPGDEYLDQQQGEHELLGPQRPAE